MSDTGAASRMKKWLQEKGLVKSPEQLEILANEYGKRYESMMADTKDPPRETTAPQSQSNTREAHTINTDAAVDRYQRVTKPMGEDLLRFRGGRVDQDTAALTARADNQTQQTLAVMGGSLRDLQGDFIASKDRTVDKSFGYYSGRDDKLLGAHKDYMDYQRGLDNRDFIMNLVGTAVMLGM